MKPYKGLLRGVRYTSSSVFGKTFSNNNKTWSKRYNDNKQNRLHPYNAAKRKAKNSINLYKDSNQASRHKTTIKNHKAPTPTLKKMVSGKQLPSRKPLKRSNSEPMGEKALTHLLNTAKAPPPVTKEELAEKKKEMLAKKALMAKTSPKIE